MIAMLAIGLAASLTFTPVDFDGVQVPVPCLSGAPTMEVRTKVWRGFVDSPLSSGYKSKQGPWTNPYYWVRITDLLPKNGKVDEEEALRFRLADFNSQVDFMQVIQRINFAKLGERQLVVLNGSALYMTRRGSLPIYFVEACFTYDKKLFQYRFASTKSKDVELALEALKDFAIISDGMKIRAESLPIGVQGKYSVGRQVIVETPVVPLPLPIQMNVFGNYQWHGVIGDPDEGGYYLKFFELKKGQGPRFVGGDEQIARTLLRLIEVGTYLSMSQAFHIQGTLTLDVESTKAFEGTKAGLRIASTLPQGGVLSGHFVRSSKICGILVCHGEKKLGDGETRLSTVDLGDLLAPTHPRIR